MAMGLLVLEPIGGIAGDMFLAAAFDVGVDPAALEGALRTLGVGGWRLEVARRTDCGIAGTHVDVDVRPGDAAVRPARDLEAPAADAEGPERPLERGGVDPDVEGRGEEHVAGDPADRLEDEEAHRHPL